MLRCGSHARCADFRLSSSPLFFCQTALVSTPTFFTIQSFRNRTRRADRLTTNRITSTHAVLQPSRQHCRRGVRGGVNLPLAASGAIRPAAHLAAWPACVCYPFSLQLMCKLRTSCDAGPSIPTSRPSAAFPCFGFPCPGKIQRGLCLTAKNGVVTQAGDMKAGRAQ